LSSQNSPLSRQRPDGLSHTASKQVRPGQQPWSATISQGSPGKPQLARGNALADLPGLAEPSRSVTAAAASDLTWAVQAASFQSPVRAASVVARLETLNYPAFERDLEFSGRGRWRVVFAGPYGTREAAAAALNGLRRIPDFEGALVKPLAP